MDFKLYVPLVLSLLLCGALSHSCTHTVISHSQLLFSLHRHPLGLVYALCNSFEYHKLPGPYFHGASETWNGSEDMVHQATHTHVPGAITY